MAEPAAARSTASAQQSIMVGHARASHNCSTTVFARSGCEF